MSQIMEEGPLREAAILTRAVENVLRKFIRLLLGRITLVKLQEMIKIIFVEEAEEKAKKDRPGKNVPLTNLALLTGLDTRTLQKMSENAEYKSDTFQEKQFLRKFSAEASILDKWSSNPQYLDQESNQPLKLHVKGAKPSFESLVSEAVIARGITTNSLLKKLIRSGSVVLDKKSQSVIFRERQYLPNSPEDEAVLIKAGLNHAASLMATVSKNLSHGDNKADRLFHRANWTSRLNKKDLCEYRKCLRESMINAEVKFVELMSNFEEDLDHPDQVSAGIGMFYFEDETTT